MKVFIAVDMEGATGVVHSDQLMPEGSGYAAAQRMLTADVNAVVAGVLAVEPRASFVIGDGHAAMRNVLLDGIAREARVVVGSANPANKPLCQLEGITPDTNMLLLVGYHAKAGTPRGLLAHTFIGSLVHEFCINNEPVGEVEINATIAGSMGIPVGLITGNSDLSAEVARFAPLDIFMSTKEVLGPTAAICLPPLQTQVLLSEAASKAVRRLQRGELKPHVVRCPLTMSVTTHRREQAERAIEAGGVDRVNDRTFAATGNDAAAVFRIVWRAMTKALEETPQWLR